MEELTKSPPRDYHDIIAKVASLKDADLSKLERLMELQRDWEYREARKHYNEMKAQAEAEMEPVRKDMVNPITRSRYASLASLMEVMQPIYSKFGFSVEFNEETPADRNDALLLVAYVSNGAERRRFQKWIPVQTTGIGGKTAMTLTHASIAAVTYGRRALLKMIFNIAEHDDDGNRAGGRLTPIPADFVSAYRTAAEAAARRGKEALIEFYNGASEEAQSCLRQWKSELETLYPKEAQE